MNIDLIKAEWAKDRFYTSCLKLIRLQHAVVVNYNIMFRMSTGIAEPNTTFYVSAITTVSQLLNDVGAARGVAQFLETQTAHMHRPCTRLD